MMDLRAVHRYSRALLELAEKQGQKTLDQLDDQLLAFTDIVRKHPKLLEIFSNSTISQSEKETLVQNLISKDTLPLLVNFIKLLIKKKRFAELHLIQPYFHRLYEKSRRIEEVEVVSCIALNHETASKLTSVLEKKFKNQIRLTQKVDPQMIGGLIVRLGNQEVNASFRDRLDNLHQLLSA